ncbi:MAG: ABC transporter ATP-binding protein [Phycisphaerales bacterium]|nr:ABC transporter ATP-binding protein [Phycisphaerales bacterium]MCB9856427.1 ABC transporter ATP-binding protein [Phycisphaerales bacterium]MCB9864558.1 ABC transporter ATP-binding protein [Phycisphaerales bacterium]
MPLLEITDLTKHYRTPDGATSTVVDVPAFSLETAEQCALRGESGSGKTTFLNLIAGILAPDGGRITIVGEDITAQGESNRDRLRATHIGYVFQTFNLLQGYTALENVELAMMLGRGIDHAFSRKLLEHVGMSQRLHYRPAQLSVGQQQRVAVARAMANHPQLVLADEPTGNLDAANAQTSLALLRELCETNNAALLLVSHDPAVLAQFDDSRDFAEINRAAVSKEATA